MPDNLDLIVIGGGTAGISAAQAAVTQRKRVLMVSEGPLGGASEGPEDGAGVAEGSGGVPLGSASGRVAPR